MPADFLLIGASRDFEKFSLMWLEKFGALGCDFFYRVGGAHANDCVIAGKAGKHMTKIRWTSQHLGNDFV